MKEWLVDYSLKYRSGEIVECTMRLAAASIEEAICKVNTSLANNRDPEIVDSAIWNVGLVAEPDDLEAPF